MDNSWTPYILIAFLLILAVSLFYGWKHRKDLLREFFPEDADPRKQKRAQKPRLNAKSGKYKPNKATEQDNPVQRATPSPKPKPNPKSAPTPTESQPEAPDDNRISDVTLETDSNPITSLQLSHNGLLLLATGKKQVGFMWALAHLEIGRFPLTRDFPLDAGDIVAISSIFVDEHLALIYADSREKTIKAMEVSFDKEIRAILTPSSFATQTFQNSVQGLVASGDGTYVMVLADRQFLRLLGPKGPTHTEYKFAHKECSGLVVKFDFSQAFVSYGNSVEIFDVICAPLGKIESNHILKGSSAVVSIAFSEKRQQLIVATKDGLISVFKSDPKAGIALRFNSTSVRIVRASPTTDELAIISHRAKMQIVDLESGKLMFQLEKVHNGEVNLLEFSGSGNLLFAASKSAPNIEAFSLVRDEDLLDDR
jgi:WD40 repeat protein